MEKKDSFNPAEGTNAGKIKHSFEEGARLFSKALAAQLSGKSMSENQYNFQSGILDVIYDAVISFDRNMIIQSWNKYAEEIYGWTEKEAIGRVLFELLKTEFLDTSTESALAELFKEGIMRSRIKQVRKDGSDIFISYSAKLIKNPKGEILGAITVNRDVTQFILAEHVAEEASRLKSNFLANMSHELRTPMTGIIGFAELLVESLKNPEYRDMAKIVYAASKRLLNTLNLILDLSRVESNKLEVHRENTKLTSIIINSINLFSAVASERNLKLEFLNIKDNIVSVDKTLIGEVLDNLIQNAILYTETGSIRVILDEINKDGEATAVVRVADTGIGIPKNRVNVIFEAFRQVSEGLGRRYEGTGLGLTITKKYIDLMNGKIEVESKLGQGSVFSIYLPIVAAYRSESIHILETITEPPESVSTGGRSVLVVEDEDINAAAVKMFLKNVCTLDFVKTGYGSVEKAKENKYDLILMDIGLRDISGVEAAELIRKIPGHDITPIVALTAYAMTGDREKLINKGFNGYLSKPFSKADLIRTVLDSFNGHNG